MKSSRQWIFAVVTIAVLVSLTGGMLVHATDASISTDKADYSPGETVRITGSGFNPSSLITVTVLRPDSSVESCGGLNSFRFNPCPLYSDLSGNFVLLYSLDGIFGGYSVYASDGTNSATTGFTDASLIVDFRQCANKDGGFLVNECHWINSILQQSNSKYAEGDPVNQRIIFSNIVATTGNVHTLTFSHQFSKGGNKAYDFLVGWNQGQAKTETLNTCGVEIGPPGSLAATCSGLSNFIDVKAPNDPCSIIGGGSCTFTGKTGTLQNRIDAFETLYGNRNIRIWGSSAFTSAALTIVGHDAQPTGDSFVLYSLTWTSSSADVRIELAGHLAVSGTTSLGWGSANGAGFISGGPYHFKLDKLDGSSTGSQDNQIKAGAILGLNVSCGTKGTTGKPVKCVANTAGGTAPITFSWSSPGGSPASGSGSALNSTASTYSVTYGAPGSYTVTVTATDAAGATVTTSTSIVINQQPKTLTISCSNATAGKPITCNATSVGGLAPITFAWSAPGGAPSSGSGPSFTTTYAVKGNKTITVTQHDGDGLVVTSSIVVTIAPQPLIVTVSCPASGVTVGKPFSCTVSASGGTSPYTGTGTFSRTESTKGKKTETFIVTDSNQVSASGSASVTVGGQPLIVTVSCSGATAGKPFTCTVSASGGTPPYTGTGSSTRTEPTKGSRTETFTVTDANGAIASGSAIVTVAPQPLVVTVDCPSSGITAGKPFNCTVSATGGTTAYSGTGTFSVTEPTKGTRTETFTVTDANGASASGSATVVVAPQPLVVTVVCSDGTAGKPVKCDVSATGGTTAYVGGGSFTRSFPVKGTYNVCFDVTDANEVTATGCDTVVIAPQPLVVTVVCSDGTAGKPIKCDVSATGGTSAYSGTGSFTRSFPVKGSYNVCFDVTDANQVTSTGCDSVVIAPQPLVVTVDCGSGQTAGKPFSCTVSATGGTTAYSGVGKFTVTEPVKGGFNECFNVTDANHITATGCDSVNVAPQPLVVTVDCGSGQTAGKPFSCVVSATGGTTAYSGTGKFTVTEPVKGTFDECFNVTDANHITATGCDTVVVAPQPLVVTVDCGSGQTSGKPFSCTVSATGGTTAYSGVGKFTVTEPVKGTFDECFTVTDANHVSASGCDTVVVAPQPLVVTVDCGSGQTAGKPFSCVVSATGGTTAYSGTGKFTVSEPVKGTFDECFTVTDANHVSASGCDTVVVAPQPLVVTVDCGSGQTAGKPFSCTVSATGGTLAYSGTGKFTLTEPVKGSFNECFDVTDANHVTATGCDSVSVAPQPLIVTVDCGSGQTAGKPFSCVVSATGGTTAYSGVGKFTVTEPVKGSFDECFDVTDANHVTATGCDTVVVAPQPLVVTVDCGSGQTAGKPFSCNVSATGGTTAYSGTGKFTVTEPVKGSFNECFTVTDANHVTASGCDSVNVAPQPLVVTVDCGSGQTAGKPFSCTVSATGGTTAYSGTGKFTVTEPVKGDFNECFNVTDANHVTASGCDTVVVAPQPLVVTVDCGSGQTAGKPFSCTVSASGGTTAYSGIGKFTVIEPVKGTFDECFNVTDANHVTATGCATVNVAPQPLVVTVDCGSGQTAGKPFECSVSATGGTAPYSGTGSFTVTEPVKGTFTETFTVTDANHVSASGSDSVSVAPQPLVVTVSCPSGLTAGKPFTCTYSATGGTAPYTSTGTRFVAPTKGPYTVPIFVTDANGVTSLGTATVIIAPQPLVVTVDCGSGQTAGKPFSCVVSATGGTTAYSGTGKLTVTEPVKGDFNECFNVTDANHVTATGCDSVQVSPQPLVVTVVCSDGTAGKPVKCDVSATGGTSAYSGTGSFTRSFPVKGTYDVCFDVTDANHVTATGCDTLVIAPQPLTITASCSDGTAGKPIQCDASASGGTGPYAFTWDVGKDGTIEGQGAKFNPLFAVKGSYSIDATVIDANQARAFVNLPVSIQPQPLVITAQCSPGTAGKPTSCSASASGGTTPYQFYWDVGKDGERDGFGDSFTTVFPVKGTFSVDAIVIDSNLELAFVNLPIIVRPQPLVLTATCSSATTGKPVTCSASATGGTGPYEFDWSVGGGQPNSGNGPTFTTTFVVKNTYTVVAGVSDANGAFDSLDVDVIVAPQALVITANCSPGTAGKPTTCHASASGGTGPYIFYWDVGKDGTLDGSGPDFSTVFAVKGGYSVDAIVVDANNARAFVNLPIIVRPQPLVITASCQPGTAGKPTTCNASASGGTTPYSFTWDVGKDGSIDGQGASFTTVFPVKGAFSIDARVTDANDATAFVNLPIVVNPQPLVITAFCQTITAGKPSHCSASASGGTQPYSFTWDVGKDGTIDGQGSGFIATFPVKGSYSIDARVTDANGQSAFVNLPLTVTPQPLVITASCSTGTAGKPIQCSASASGGTGPYTFTWDKGKDGTVDATGPTASFIFPVKGSFSIDANVRDSNGAITFVNLPITIRPQPLVADFTSVCTAGSTVSFTATASGGTGPYTFSWAFGDSTIGGGNPVTHTYATSGSFNVVLTVTDTNGASTQVKKNVKSCGVFFTDTMFCNFDAKPGVPGRQFRYIFIQDPANPSAFKMVATNPGQFYANVIFVGTPGSNETLTVTIPWPFITQGNKPIQVHSAISPTAPGCLGFSDDITSGFTISGLSSVSTAGYPIIVSGDYGGSKGIGSTVTFTVTGIVPPTGMIYITVHLDVKLKGTTGWTKSPIGCTDCNAVNTSLGITLSALQSYTTSAHDTAFSGSDTFQSNNVFKKDPGFAGVVTNAAGTPLAGVKVKIYSPTGLLATVYTDSDGVYMYQYKYSGKEVTFTITLPDYGITTPVQVKSNRLVLQNFQLTI